MFIIDSNMAGISWILTSALFVVIHIMTPPQHWGEVTQALLYHQVRKLLLRLDGSRRHVRNWRPQLLLLMSLSDSGGGDGGGAEVLAATLNHVKKSGLLLLAHVVPVLGRDTEVRRLGEVGVGGHTPMAGGRASSLSKRSPAAAVAAAAAPGAWTSAARSVQSRTRDLLDMIDYNGWKAFPAVAMGASLLSGVQTLVSGGAGLGSLAPNTVCMGLYDEDGGASGGARRSDWLGGEEEYLTAMQTCLFFGKSLLVARGFGGASLLDERSGVSGGGGSREAGGGGGVAGASEARQVDVWVFPVDGSGGPSAGGRSRRHRNVGSSDEEDDDDGGGEAEDRMGRWPSDSTLSLSLQLAYLYVEARRRQAYSNGSGVVWRLRLLSYVEATEDVAPAEEWLAETLAAARIPSVYSSLRVVVVQQLSLPLYQQLERTHTSPGPAAHRPGMQERSPPRRPGPSVLRVLEPLELCQVQNAVVHASTEFGSALLLLPLPVLPMLAASEGGSGGGASAWISTVSELGSGLPPSLMVHNPTTAVISTRV